MLPHRSTNIWLTSITAGSDVWTLTSSAVETGSTRMSRNQGRPCARWRLWFVFGRTAKVSFIKSCCGTTQPSQLTCADSSWIDWLPEPNRRARITARFYSYTITLTQTRVSGEKLLALGWEVLPPPPCSPDVVPTDYHLLLSLFKVMQGKSLKTCEPLVELLVRKPEAFYTVTSEGCLKSGGVIDDGNYIDS